LAKNCVHKNREEMILRRIEVFIFGGLVGEQALVVFGWQSKCWKDNRTA
jgi:hypothetical protein